MDVFKTEMLESFCVYSRDFRKFIYNHEIDVVPDPRSSVIFLFCNPPYKM